MKTLTHITGFFLKKTIVLPFLVFILSSLTVLAQTVPQGMNYQAVARDHQGAVLPLEEISLRVSLMSEGPDGKVLYREIHDATTNKLGLFNLIIGQGMPEKGIFADIPWSSTEIWMDLALSWDGSTDYSFIGTSRLMSVPYALHAGSADKVINQSGDEKTGGKKWSTEGNNIDATDKLGSLNNFDLRLITNNTDRVLISKMGEVTIYNDLDVTGDVTAVSFAGDGSALTGINVNDADNDPANELQSLSQTGNNVTLSDGGGTVSVADNDNDPTNELQDWSNLPGIPADISDGDDVNDADSDPANELQDWSNLPGIPADISDGDDVNDADSDPTNELQDWSSLPGIPADISDGDDVNDADSDPTNELQDWSNLPGIPADISDGDDVNDADSDPTNELQDWSNLPGIPADILDGDDVNDADSDPTNELQDWSNLPGIPADILDGDDVNDADSDPTNELQDWSNLPGIPADISDGDDVNDADSDPTNELQDWSNLPGIPADILDGDDVNDADSDPTNELQDWSNLPGIPADISDGDDVNDADSDPTNELQDWSNLPGIPADILDGDDVNDADSDPTNELQDWSNLPGIPADISDGDDVNDADSDPANELNSAFQLSGNNLTITDGGGSLVVDLSSIGGSPNAENGQYFYSPTNAVRLGGALIENTTISSGSFSLNIDLTGSGDFRVQDAGISHFEVRDNGLTYFGDDTYWKDGGTTGTTIARLYDSGDDGIFEVYSNGAVQHKINSVGATVFNEQGTNTADFRIESDSRSNLFFVDASSNRIGINNAAPDHIIHFESTGENNWLTAWDNSYGTGALSRWQNLSSGNDNRVALGITNYSGSAFETPGIMGLSINYTSTGSGGIGVMGTANNESGNAVEGNLFFTGSYSGWAGYFNADVYSGGAYIGSDKRLKKNIESIRNALDIVNHLNPVSYNYDIDKYPRMGFDDRVSYGFIAQELEKVLPELVKEKNLVLNSNRKRTAAMQDDEKRQTEKFKVVNYTLMVPVLTQAIKEQQEVIKSQQDQIAEQNKRLEVLEAAVARLLAE